jgi:hypothetical protein
MTTVELETLLIAAPGQHRGRARPLYDLTGGIRQRVDRAVLWFVDRLTQIDNAKHEYREALVWQQYAALAEGVDSELYPSAGEGTT